ncbi:MULTISPECIES: hypothetical protein [unclassified Bradyrhizobium]|uniref:hypothetical protein n=1 Tax=unclassified Bradyrhizobium TaxID=2631580 RepID=UPI0028E613D5|nr:MULTISPECIES: hypothetical protein [unclassified Bradyrhizobium]
MDVREFEDLIDRLGEDVSCWPEGQRQIAAELLASSPEARALLEEARALRQALSSPAVRAPAGLADRIVAAAGRLEAVTPAADEGTVEAVVDAPHPG